MLIKINKKPGTKQNNHLAVSVYKFFTVGVFIETNCLSYFLVLIFCWLLYFSLTDLGFAGYCLAFSQWVLTQMAIESRPC